MKSTRWTQLTKISLAIQNIFRYGTGDPREAARIKARRAKYKHLFVEAKVYNNAVVHGDAKIY